MTPTLFTEVPTLKAGNFLNQIDYFPIDVRALSWNQPYGSLMLHGKQETRSRNTNVRGWVLICTCLKPYNYEVIKSISGEEQTYRITELLHFKGKPHHLDVLGMAIGIGFLNNSRLMKPTKEDEDLTFVQYSILKYVWEFTEVHAIKPFPRKGKQGWSLISVDEMKKIEIL